MKSCIKCGAALSENVDYCEACGTSQNGTVAPKPVAAQNSHDDIKAILLRIEEIERKNQILFKSISSATAILAGLVILQVLSLLFSFFFAH